MNQIYQLFHYFNRSRRSKTNSEVCNIICLECAPLFCLSMKNLRVLFDEEFCILEHVDLFSSQIMQGHFKFIFLVKIIDLLLTPVLSIACYLIISFLACKAL